MLATPNEIAHSLELIAAEAEAHEASVSALTSDALTVQVRLRRADGITALYDLKVAPVGTGVWVQEVAPKRLPAFCPNRHINCGGSFCLSWDGADALPISNVEDAQRWWATLLGFLRLQERAAIKRRWPNRREWAHGAAAEHQQKAERNALSLGAQLSALMAAGALEVKTKKGGFSALWGGGRRLLSVWNHSQRVATLRQACPCGSGLVFRECADHAGQAVALVAALKQMEIAEARFWKSFQGRSCCGTLDDCPLRTAATANSNMEEKNDNIN